MKIRRVCRWQGRASATGWPSRSPRGTLPPIAQPFRSELVGFRGQRAYDLERTALLPPQVWLEECGFLAVSRPANLAARIRELRRAAEAAAPRASDRNFNLARGHCQRHVELRAKGQAFPDGIGDVRLGFSFGPSLADATRNRRTLRYVRAVFVLVDAHGELHSVQTIAHSFSRLADLLVRPLGDFFRQRDGRFCEFEDGSTEMASGSPKVAARSSAICRAFRPALSVTMVTVAE